MIALTRPCGPSSKRRGAAPMVPPAAFSVSPTLCRQRRLEVDGAAVLLEQIGEGLVGEFLGRPALPLPALQN
jgi:hypothetical protein